MVNWYKRDPDRALTGMRGLTHDEKSAYGTIIDLSYSRDGDVPDDERFLCTHIECRPQWWRRVRASLIAKGKLKINTSETGAKLVANRVETTLKEARNFSETQSKRAAKGWEKRKKFNVINHPSMPLPAMPPRNASTTTPRIEEPKEVSSILGGVSSGTNSERAPEGGSLASAVGGAPREPPSVAPAPDTTKESKPESKRLTEEAKARQADAMRLLEMSPHERREFMRHAQSGNGRAGMETTGPVVPASAGPGPIAPEPDVSQPEQPGVPALDGVLPKPNGQGSELHDASATVAPSGDVAKPRTAWVKPKPLDSDYWDNIVNGN